MLLQMQSNIKPSINHVKVFEHVTQVHILEQRRKKLEDQGKQCIYVQYESRIKTYKLYNPNTKKRIISRDVEFDEEDYQRWSNDDKNIKGVFLRIMMMLIGDVSRSRSKSIKQSSSINVNIYVGINIPFQLERNKLFTREQQGGR